MELSADRHVLEMNPTGRLEKDLKFQTIRKGRKKWKMSSVTKSSDQVSVITEALNKTPQRVCVVGFFFHLASRKLAS